MATNPAHLGALLYADEASWAEVSTTYDERLPIIGGVNAILQAAQHPKEPAQITEQYNNAGRRDALMPKIIEFDIPLYLTGHGTSCASGAIAATALGTFLARCMGQVNAGQTSGTVNAGTSAVQFSLTTAVGVAGALFRLGLKGDGEGEGEWYVWNNPATATILNAAAGTPVNGAVVYGAETVHVNETLTTVTSMRFNVLTANQRLAIFGCYCKGMTFSGFGVGELPQVVCHMVGSFFDEEPASTWPTAVAVESFVPAPCTAGNLFVQTVGTATRTMRQVRDLKLTLDFETFPQPGYNTARQYQTIIGCVRGRVTPKIAWTEDAEAAGTQTLVDMYESSNLKHIMASLSTADSQSVAFYLANAKMIGPRPNQQDIGGTNQVTAAFQGMAGPTATTELTHSAFRMGLA